MSTAYGMVTYHMYQNDRMLMLIILKQEAQLSPRNPRDAVSTEILVYCCTHNANRSRVCSLMSTFSNCHVLFR